MSAILCAPSCDAATAELTLERCDISFHCPKLGQVAIAATLTNLGERPSPATLVRFQSAPLGAFVDWQPLAEVFVPEIAPGGRRRVCFNVNRPRGRALGDPAKIPPARLLTALGMGEPEPSRDRRPLDAPDDASSQPTSGFQTGSLAADLFELLGHDNPHWAGNLNVFVAAKPVERHFARALRIYPGRPNMAMFVVGSAPDAYCFALRGGGAQWQCGLYDPSLSRKAATILSAASDAALVEEDRWIEIERQTWMMLAIRPPAKCDRGSLEVHVTQRSSGHTAIVEFDLDPRAAGPGCFVV